MGRYPLKYKKMGFPASGAPFDLILLQKNETKLKKAIDFLKFIWYNINVVDLEPKKFQQ